MDRILSIGTQSFKDLRERNCIYVDKTDYIRKLVNKGKVYFLSRPRRFGKSLFISTLEAYFRGRRELFKGLAIEEYEKKKENEAWISYPVISFPLANGIFDRPDGLSNKLAQCLSYAEEEYGVEGAASDLAVRFFSDLRKIKEKTGRQVVVLVDEYDNPLLKAGSREQEDKNRSLYKGFFSALKDQDEYVRFAFFTGVTKFSKVSIFSDLNQLKDISFLEEYSAVCGITEKELKECYAPEIDRLAERLGVSHADCLVKLKEMYDGYHFSENVPGVYNPFSVISALDDGRLDTYWFESGTPSFVVEKLAHSSINLERLDSGVDSTESEMKDYRTENPNPIPFLYQSGYLTIKKYDSRFREYHLGFPNTEVADSFANYLVPYVIGQKDSERPSFAKDLVIAFEKGDTDTVYKNLYSLFAGIPYIEKKELDYESVWRNQIYLIFKIVGEFVICEPHTSQGRADCVVETSDYIYVMEFKVDRSAEEALDQIEKKDYIGRYIGDKRKLIKIGCSFSSDKRNIDQWEAR